MQEMRIADLMQFLSFKFALEFYIVQLFGLLQKLRSAFALRKSTHS
jgi:hypothetical protein